MPNLTIVLSRPRVALRYGPGPLESPPLIHTGILISRKVRQPQSNFEIFSDKAPSDLPSRKAVWRQLPQIFSQPPQTKHLHLKTLLSIFPFISRQSKTALPLCLKFLYISTPGSHQKNPRCMLIRTNRLVLRRGSRPLEAKVPGVADRFVVAAPTI